MSLRVARKHASFRSKHQLLCSSLVLEKYFSNTSPNIPPGDKHATDEVPVFEYPRPSPSSRRVYSWGVAETGALGFFTPSIKRRLPRIPQCCDHPRRITFSHVYEVKDLACGYGFTAFSVRPGSKEAKVFGCGLNTDSQIGYHSPNRTSHLALLLNPAPIEIPFKNPKSRVKGLAAGRAHLLVCTEEGVFSLGNNAYGQCGRPVIENEKYSGSRVINRIPSIDGVDIRSVACGQDHSMFITEKGEVFACGWNADGQTAQGHYESHWAVKQVTGDIKGEDIKKVACTGDCVLALSSKGQVFGWGNAEYGQLGRDLLQLSVSRHLASCESFGKIVDVAAGGSLCMILNEEGQVFVWGYGILGKGPKVDKSFEPTEIPSVLFGRNHFVPDSKVMKIACGLNHQMAINNKGELFAWGHNRGGCLGIGNKDDQFFPLRVAVGATVHEVHCGVDHTVALCSPF